MSEVKCPCDKTDDVKYKELKIRDPNSDPVLPRNIILDTFYICNKCGIRFNKV